MKLRSLRARLIAGITIWTIVILVVMFFTALALAIHLPRQTWLIHNSLVMMSGVIIATAGVLLVRRGLSPFRLLRERLSDVRDGRSARLSGEYPTEVVPLVDDLNALLEERERRVARAVAKAGDLAHGLKTPLAVLAKDIDGADAAGQHDLAASMRRQVERMRRQIDWHLVQARATAAGPTPRARANLGDCARGLARALERLYADRALAITVDVASNVTARVPVEDLEEMLGNLLDNACKWAKSRVSVTAALHSSHIVIDVDDDGTGLDPAMRDQVLRRGVRADEGAPGSGLGLAIVRELAGAYGGGVALDRSPDGGVRARLTLPATERTTLP
jgi:signal transduction histidine kinase